MLNKQYKKKPPFYFQKILGNQESARSRQFGEPEITFGNRTAIIYRYKYNTV